jgi:tetratricopeptide (TPR) repeat protein
MDRHAQQRLQSQLRRGQVILFTGAGFSIGAKTRDGRLLPGVGELGDELWKIAFGNDPRDDSTLQDVYEAALRQARKATIELLRERLTVDPNSLNDTYRLWFSYPWYRIYTVNVDTLAAAAEHALDLPRKLRVVSGLSESAQAIESPELQVIHLNGTLSDVPDVTFSMRQYAQRAAGSDLWYENLVRELQMRPVLYVGTQLNEPALWTYIEARADKPEREFRPGSYLVTPDLPRARRVALGGYNITWVEANADEFASGVLGPLDADANEGRAAIGERLVADHEGRIVLPLLDIIDDSQDDAREFLGGREPRWSDLTHGYAFTRESDDDLAAKVDESHPRLVLVTGTAGTGKSTTAMHLVLRYAERGKDVFLLNRYTNARFRAIRGAVEAAGVDVLLIDDLDRFGDSTRDLLFDLLGDNNNLVIIGCIRSSRLEALGDVVPSGISCEEFVVPQLCAADVDELLNSLDRANRLGALKGLNAAQRRQRVESRFGRQLLVAMIEITNNQRFHEKVESECKQLERVAARVYAAASVATALHTGLTDDELVIAARAENPSDAMAAIDRLTARHLLTRTASRRLAVRHSVIADHAVTYFAECGTLPPVVTFLAFALASTARLDDLKATPSGRLLIRLLNHGYLIQRLYRRVDRDVDHAAVRAVYSETERLLSGDYHYWLQRGSFETEEGNIEDAKNFLEQARSINPDDPYVRTEWSYMAIRRASRNPEEGWAVEDVETAFSELEDVIRIRGKRDAHPFHVYGSQGLAWIHRGPLSVEGQRRLFERLRRMVDRGLDLHADHEDLQNLKRDLDREYMMTAVAPEDRERSPIDPGTG